MTYEIKNLRNLIRETLIKLNMWSDFRENLLLGTAAVESNLGRYRRQIGGGPALGIYQMEPSTHIDIWQNYLKYRTSLTIKVQKTCKIKDNKIPDATNLINDDIYATVMAHLQYFRRTTDHTFPHSDIHILASYWKKYYNTLAGAGTEEKFIEAYQRFVK